jgi:Ca2+-binding RTX toxin-like protein
MSSIPTLRRPLYRKWFRAPARRRLASGSPSGGDIIYGGGDADVFNYNSGQKRRHVFIYGNQNGFLDGGDDDDTVTFWNQSVPQSQRVNMQNVEHLVFGNTAINLTFSNALASSSRSGRAGRRTRSNSGTSSRTSRSWAGDGSDTVYLGGAGSYHGEGQGNGSGDTFDFSAVTSVTWNLADGIVGWLGNTAHKDSFEIYKWNSNGIDTVICTNGSDIISGGASIDHLYGGGGMDTIRFGDADIMSGGTEKDTFMTTPNSQARP